MRYYVICDNNRRWTPWLKYGRRFGESSWMADPGQATPLPPALAHAVLNEVALRVDGEINARIIPTDRVAEVLAEMTERGIEEKRVTVEKAAEDIKPSWSVEVAWEEA